MVPPEEEPMFTSKTSAIELDQKCASLSYILHFTLYSQEAGQEAGQEIGHEPTPPCADAVSGNELDLSLVDVCLFMFDVF